jgi:SAM-dependent methyltransferase
MLDNTSNPVPLSDERFLETHVIFEGSSTQQDQILECLARHGDRAPALVLSLGCGSGILDGPLAARLAARLGPQRLRYVGLDPNPLHCRLLRRRFEQLPIDGEVVVGRFEGYHSVERFDRVLMIHTHYYLDDVPQGLARAAARVAPGGAFVIAAAPRGDLNRLAQLFWPDRTEEDLWFSEELSDHFATADVTASRVRIDARLDVSACFDGRDEGDAIRDFVVQADTRQLSARIRRQIDDALRLMGRVEPNGRWTVPHPVDLFVLDANASEPLARAAEVRTRQRARKTIATR